MKNFLEKPKVLQLEISSVCNALCLGCVRTDVSNFNRSKPLIPNNVIVEPDTIKQVLESNLMSALDDLEFCGTIDEPTVHPFLPEILDIAYKHNKDFFIKIHTNGSTRTTKYWKKLATQLKKFPRHIVFFSIDGLNETHSIYRQHTNFNKIIDNAKAFINEGGHSIWQFLEFPWNKHQIEDAKKLSKELKFYDFHLRYDRSVVTEIGLDNIKKLQKSNYEGDNIYSKDRYNKEYKKQQRKELKRKQDLIECNALQRDMFFLSYDSKLWPCCFLSNAFLAYGFHKEYMEKRIIENYGKDFNNLLKFSVDEIIEHRFFKEDLIDSFTKNIGYEKKNKIPKCMETCNCKILEKKPIGGRIEAGNKINPFK